MKTLTLLFALFLTGCTSTYYIEEHGKWERLTCKSSGEFSPIYSQYHCKEQKVDAQEAEFYR